MPYTSSNDTWILRVRNVQVGVKAVGNNYCSQTTIEYYQQTWALENGVWVDKGYLPVSSSIDPTVKLTTNPPLSNANDRPLAVTVNLTAGSFERFEVRSLQLGIDDKIAGSGPYTKVASLPASTVQANVTARLFYPAPRPPDPTTTTAVTPTTEAGSTTTAASTTAPPTTVPVPPTTGSPTSVVPTVVPTSVAPPVTTNPEQVTTTTTSAGSTTAPGTTQPGQTTTTNVVSPTSISPTSIDPAATTTTIVTTGASTDRTVTFGVALALVGLFVLMLAARWRKTEAS